MKFSLDILFILLKDFLVSQGEKEMAEKISQLIESNEKDLLDIRKAVKFTDILKCFFKQNPRYSIDLTVSLKKLINTKSEQIIEKLTKQNEESDEEDSDTEEDPVEEVKQPVKKVTTTNGKPQPQQNNNKTVKVQPTNEVQNEDRDTQLLGNKTERKPFQRIDETLKEKLPEVLKNNSYDVINCLKVALFQEFWR
jgi:hypothetical protein